MYKKGFTLSEVLIALGVIGVVAAMTLPTVIVNYQKQQTVIKLKKVYSTVAQAIRSSEIDNDNLEYWEYTLSAENFYKKYLKNYIKSTEAVSQSMIKQRITYRYLNGANDAGGLNNNSSYTIKTLDGMFITIDGWASTGSRGIIFDINGFQRPNQTGKDVFWFFITKKGLIYNSTDDCKKTNVGAGYGCAKRIIQNGWQIPDGYPW